MNFVLLSLLIVIFLLNYYFSKENILYPSVIISAVFLLSTFLLVVNQSRWNYFISIETVIFVVTANILVSGGIIIGTNYDILLVIPKSKNRALFSNQQYQYYVSDLKMFFLNAMCISVSIAFSIHQYRVAKQIDNAIAFWEIISTLRSQVISNPSVFQLGIGLNLGIAFCRAIGYISIFLLVSGIANKNMQEIYKYLVPVFCLIYNTIIATGRSALITITVSFIFNIFIIQRNQGIHNFNQKIIKYIIIGVLSFFTVFRFAGNLTGKSQLIGLWDTISIYAGSSILCLDHLISNGWRLSTHFGLHSFVGIYNLLNRLGMSLPTVPNHADFVYWSNFSSNVYTSFYPYLLDFGIISTLFLQFFIGLLFGVFWKRYLEEFKNPFWVVTYSRFLGSSLVLYSIAEVLVSSNLALNTFAEFLFYFLLVRFLF